MLHTYCECNVYFISHDSSNTNKCLRDIYIQGMNEIQIKHYIENYRSQLLIWKFECPRLFDKKILMFVTFVDLKIHLG